MLKTYQIDVHLSRYGVPKGTDTLRCTAESKQAALLKFHFEVNKVGVYAFDVLPILKKKTLKVIKTNSIKK